MAKGRMTAAKRDYLQAQGKDLFAKGFSIPNIGELLGVGEKTLYKWRDEHNWEKARELALIKPSEIKNMILEYLVALRKGESVPYKADDLSKVSAAFDRLNDSRKKAVYTMETFDDFTSHIIGLAGKSKGEKRNNLLQQLKDMRVIMDSYVNELLQQDD